MSVYRPMQSIESGAWYAAREIAGMPGNYAADLECGSQQQAKEACDILNKTSREQRAAVLRDLELRGVRR